MALINKQTADPTWGTFAASLVSSYSSLNLRIYISFCFLDYKKADTQSPAEGRITTRLILRFILQHMLTTSAVMRSGCMSISHGDISPRAPKTQRGGKRRLTLSAEGKSFLLQVLQPSLVRRILTTTFHRLDCERKELPQCIYL